MAEREPADGRLIAGRYRLAHLLGRGGMGAVWAAQDELLGRPVAVKEVVPPPGLTPQERQLLRRRALREARAAARIVHPCAVTVYDVVDDEDGPWIVMQRLGPRTLADALAASGRLPPETTARIGLDLLGALEAAHGAGVLHRDVKPTNVILEPSGRAVLTDFGIATVEDDPTLTSTGLLVGSPGYMSPERARGEKPTAASDLWSLGATLYAAVEGRPPFVRDGQLATLNAVITEEVPPAAHAGDLGPVIARLLAKDTSERPDVAQSRALLARVRHLSADPATRAAPEAGQSDTEVVRMPALMPTEREPEPTAAWTPTPTAPDLSPPSTSGGEFEAAPWPAAPEPPPEAEVGPGPEPEAQPDPEPEVQPDPEPEAQPDPEPEAQPDPEPESQPDYEPEVQPAPEPEVRPWQQDSAVESEQADGASAATTAPERVRPAAARVGGDRRWLVVVGGLVVAAALVTVVALSLAHGSGRHPSQTLKSPISATATPAPTRTTGPSAAGTAAAPATTTPPATPTGSTEALRAGFRLHSDPTGFRLAVPRGWKESRSGSDVYFRDPKSRSYLQVDQTAHPKPDALQNWKAEEAGAAGRFPGYRLLRLKRVAYHDWDAADWEFTWRPSGGELHVINRNVRVNGHRAYALLLSVPADDWTEGEKSFQVITDSFVPAS